MPFGEELRQAVARRRPDAVCLGAVCYVRLDSWNLAKVEFASSGGYYNGITLTVFNRHTGPVDSVTIHSHDLPLRRKRETPGCGSDPEWGICRPALDLDTLWVAAENYLLLFQEPDSEKR